MYADSTSVPTIAQPQSPIATDRLVGSRSYPQLAPGIANASTRIVWNAFGLEAPREKMATSIANPRVTSISVRMLILAIVKLVKALRFSYSRVNHLSQPDNVQVIRAAIEVCRPENGAR